MKYYIVNSDGYCLKNGNRNMIKLEKETDASYKVLFNTKYLGMAEMGVDGFYNFYADDNKGYWSSYSLRLIADKLDELNKEWSDYIKENLK